MKLKAKIRECRKEVKAEVCYVGRLPDPNEHKHHDSAKVISYPFMRVQKNKKGLL